MLGLVRRDGTALPILVTSSAVRGPDGVYLRSRTTLTDLTDLTERKRAEGATRLFADVVRIVPIGLLTYRLDDAGDPHVLRVRSAKPAAARLLGVSLDEAAGRPITDDFSAVPPGGG